MLLQFVKYQGTGNDFILVDNRDEGFPKESSIIQKLCDRKFGIGSDGLILIETHLDLDYRMVFFNPDGSKSLCGNGSRCGFAFAQTLGMVSEEATFETTDGIHRARQDGDLVSFSLADVAAVERIGDDFYVDTGSPHYIRLVKDLDQVDVVSTGRGIRQSERFVGQNGTNVNFAQLLQNGVQVRTYERGVENETLSCGTGVTAVALVAGEQGLQSPVQVMTRGGNLNVDFEKNASGYTNIWLTGPAVHVFSGSIEI